MREFEQDTDGDELLTELDLESVFVKEFSDATNADELVFHEFPHQHVYPQQLDLMRSVYHTLEHNKCGLFESPTGTGKTISILTAVFKWLYNHNRKQLDLLKQNQEKLSELDTTTTLKRNESTNVTTNLELDWVEEFAQKRLQRQQIEPELENLVKMKDSLDKIDQIARDYKCKKLPSNHSSSDKNKHSVFVQLDEKPNEDDFASNFLLTDSDDEVEEKISDELHHGSSDKVKSSNLLQIVYCSRTHSQLNQVLKEFRNLVPSFPTNWTSVQLSSRAHLCVNPVVFQLKHPDLINQACLDLNQRKTNKKCVYRKTVDQLVSKLLMNDLSSIEFSSKIRNKNLCSTKASSIDSSSNHAVSCPYYANRRALKLAQLILIPYSILLSDETRLACGLDLNNSILVIDEAHNLLDATTSSKTVYLDFSDLQFAELLVQKYSDYYRTRLSALILLRLRQLAQFIKLFKSYLVSKKFDPTKPKVLTINEFLSDSNLDHINLDIILSCFRDHKHFLMKLVGFSKWFVKRVECGNNGLDGSASVQEKTDSKQDLNLNSLLMTMKRKSDLGPKVNEFTNKRQRLAKIGSCSDNVSTNQTHSNTDDKENSKYSLDNSGASLLKLYTFLQAIANSEEDARLLIATTHMEDPNPVNLDQVTGSKSIDSIRVKLTVLNPGHYLTNIVKQCRSVLLIGGTLKPFDELIQQIFAPAEKQSETQITQFACGPIINVQSQLLIHTIGNFCHTEPVTFDFTFQNRNDTKLMDSCGQMLLNICEKLPAGIVVFFPSYEYKSLLCSRWEKIDLMRKIQKCKKVFQEPKNPNSLEQIMAAYECAASDQNAHGAILLCVIGGKLSEGINFANDLARVVVIIGMPYSNPNCPLLIEKMTYLDKNFKKQQIQKMTPGRQYYESLCMRSINQAIGRAIRHRNDYAIVFLFDRRFEKASVKQELSDWLRQSIHPQPSNKLIDLTQFQLTLNQCSEFLDRNKREMCQI